MLKETTKNLMSKSLNLRTFQSMMPCQTSQKKFWQRKWKNFKTKLKELQLITSKQRKSFDKRSWSLKPLLLKTIATYQLLFQRYWKLFPRFIEIQMRYGKQLRIHTDWASSKRWLRMNGIKDSQNQTRKSLWEKLEGWSKCLKKQYEEYSKMWRKKLKD